MFGLVKKPQAKTPKHTIIKVIHKLPDASR